MTYEETKAGLLQQNDDDSDSEHASYPRNYDFQQRGTARRQRSILSPLIWTALAFSLILNVFFVWSQRILKAQAHLCISEYSK